MSKRSSGLSFVYLVGMALVVVGFFCPMFKQFGMTRNGFDFINFNNFGMTTVGALLLLIGAAAGVVIQILKPNKTYKLAALAIAVAGAVLLILLFTGLLEDNKLSSGIQKFIGKNFLKSAYYGFYTVIVGLALAITGFVTNK